MVIYFALFSRIDFGGHYFKMVEVSLILAATKIIIIINEFHRDASLTKTSKTVAKRICSQQYVICGDILRYY